MREFWAGVRAVSPLMLGATPFGVIFGALAVASGLSPLAALGMSLVVFAGSSQFIGATLVGQGATLPVIILTTFVVNARHALYSASLAPYLKHLPQRWLLPLGFFLTDEAYAVTIREFEEGKTDPSRRHWFMFGTEFSMYLNWQLWTIVGIVAGAVLAADGGLGLDFAMSVTFIGITVPLIRNRPMLAAAVVSGVVGMVTYGLPNKLGLLIAAAAGIVTGYLLETARAGKPVEVAIHDPQ